MSLFRTNKTNHEIDLTKARGKIKFETIEHKGKFGGDYYCIKAMFEDGTSLLIDMQLIELLNVQLHKKIRNQIGKTDSTMDLMDDLMELVTGDVIRDRILKSIYD